MNLCGGDRIIMATKANRCQQRLINAGGETGWWGGWAKIVFNITRANPFITLPREFARAIGLNVCKAPIRIQNEFYEVLEAGIGLRPGTCITPWCGAMQGFERGSFPTLVDLPSGPQFLRAYTTDDRDPDQKRMLIDALDDNGNRIYSDDGGSQVRGFYLNFTAPFVTSGFTVTQLVSVLKDATYGDVILVAVDPATGLETQLARYAPDELSPAYRRYYIDQLPQNCCSTLTPGVVQVTATCKYEFIPVVRDTDYLIIGNEEAMIEEGKSLRYSDMDSSDAFSLEQKSHNRAIKLLQDELTHYLGRENPAINFAPWRNDTLERSRIGTLI